MNDKIQKRAGLPTVRPAKAALGSLREQAERQKAYAKAEVNVVYEDLFICLDVSNSMIDPINGFSGREKMEAALEAAQGLIDASSAAKSRMGLVTYGDNAHLLCPQTSNYPLLLASLIKIKPEGWTNIGGGLEACAERLGAASKAKSKRIILLTDGHEITSWTGPPKRPALNVVREILVPNKIVVDCIAFGSDADETLLDTIAAMTGGKFVKAYQEIELKKAFLQLETGVRGLLASENT